MPVPDCPTRDELAAYVIGRLDHQNRDAIADHLDQCSHCQESIQTIEDADDTLVAALREAPGEIEFVAEAACQQVIARIAEVGRRVSTDEAAPASADVEDVDLGHLGHYRLLAELGAGGMGAVYKALHTKLKRVVALKILPTDKLLDERAVERFEREMEAVGQLSHPNIVVAHDAGEIDGKHYLVMELVEGIDLSKIARQVGRLSVADACELIRQTAIGLQHGHENGMVHRDIKPSNLMLSRRDQAEPGSAVVKILDMGLALLDQRHEPRELTTTGQMMGTVEYMAPEQGTDSHLVDIRADIYATGASLFKLLCGEAPFPGTQYDNPLKLMMAKATKDPTSIAAKRDDLPTDLVAIVDRMLARDPEQRFSEPVELAEALDPFTGDCDLVALLDRATAEPSETAQQLVATDEYLSSPHTDTDESVDQLGAMMDPDTAETADKIVNRKSSARSEGRRISKRRGLAIATTLALLGVIVFGVVTLVFQTKEGTIVIEIQDPGIQVTIEGEDITIADKKSEPITLRAGDHRLHVKYGKLKFTTEEFELPRGKQIVISARLVEGRVEVVQDEKPLDSRAVENHALTEERRDAEYQVAKWVTSLSDSWVVKIEVEGKQQRIESPVDLPESAFLVREIDIIFPDVSKSEDLRRLQTLKGLRRLSLCNVDLDDATASLVSGIRTIELLSLKDTNVTDQGLQDLATLPKLDNLSLSRFEPTREYDGFPSPPAIERFSVCGSLRELWIGSYRWTNDDVRRLAQLTQLEKIHLDSSAFSDDARLSELRGLPNLRHVSIVGHGVSDKQLADLAKLVRLEWISLEFSKVTDDGIQHLHSLAAPKRIELRRTQVSATGIARLKSRFPQCKIDSDFSEEQIATAMAKIDANQPSAVEWKPGPEEGQLAGVIARPAKLAGIKRWQVETQLPRAYLNSVKWSSQNEIACATQTGVVRIYDGDALGLQSVLPVCIKSVNAVAWNRDGDQLAVGGSDVLQIWSQEGRLIHDLEGSYIRHGEGLISWSHDGEKLATVNNLDNSLRIWDLSDESCRTCRGHGSSISCVCWSPNGKQIATSSRDKTVRIWTADGTFVRAIEHPGSVNALAWSPDQTQLATGCDDGLVRIWSLKEEAEAKLLKGHGGAIRDVDWSLDGLWLASASADSKARLWTSGGAIGPILEGHKHYVTSVSFSPDSSRLVTASRDRSLRVWSLDGTLEHSVVGHADPVMSISWRPDSASFVEAGNSGNEFGRLQVWSRGGEPGKTLLDGAQVAAWSPAGDQLAAQSGSVVQLFSANYEPIGTLGYHDFGVDRLQWSRTGEFLAVRSGSENTIWAVRAVKSTPVDHVGYPIWGLDVLATVGRDEVRLWDGTGTRVGSFKHDVNFYVAAWSPLGDHIAIGSGSPRQGIQILETDGTQSAELLGFTEGVHDVAWSPNGQRIASGDYSSMFRIWTSSGDSLCAFEDPNVFGLSWSPNGAELVGGSPENSMLMRDGKTGEPLWTAILLPDDESVTFNAAGQILHGDRDVVERGFVYIVESKVGQLELLRPSEFEARIARSLWLAN